MISGIPTALVARKGVNLEWTSWKSHLEWTSLKIPWRKDVGTCYSRDTPIEPVSRQLATLTTGILNNKQLKRFSVALKAHDGRGRREGKWLNVCSGRCMKYSSLVSSKRIGTVHSINNKRINGNWDSVFFESASGFPKRLSAIKILNSHHFTKIVYF